MKAHEFIDGNEMVIRHFGVWPDFHDGEVLRVVLERERAEGAGKDVPCLGIDIRGCMGPALTEQGHDAPHHDAVVSFRFEDIFDLELEGFNSQNVLSSLTLSLEADPNSAGQILLVELAHCYLFEGVFRARRACVQGIRPWEEVLACR